MGKALYLLMSMQLFLQLSALVAYSRSPLSPPQHGCHDEDRSALLEFKRSTGRRNPDLFSDPSSELEGSLARNCCSWQGVTCGGPYGRVIGLSLEYCELYGSLSSTSSIFRLVHLQELDLSSNSLYGPISPSVSNLTQLVTLDLSSNSLYGPISPSLSNLTQLVTLRLSSNSLDGPIPPQIASLRSMRELSLSACNFQGPIPPSISNLTKLNVLDLSSNSFRGPILPFVLGLTQLVELNLGGNQFTGDIPPSLTNLIQLTLLDLGLNQFTGEIPRKIGSLAQLKGLHLSFNKLDGHIPTSLFQLRNLATLRLGPNNFRGMLQLDMFSGMEQLEELILSFSTPSLAIGSADYAHSLPYIQILGLARCNLTEFPRFLGKLEGLKAIDLSFNNLSGQVPEWFLNERLQTLAFLNLSGNSLTGFPRDLSYYDSTSLEVLDLRANKLQGSLPIPTGTPMSYLVSNNLLSGKIPQQICDWSVFQLKALDLSKNKFTGEIPQCLSNFSSLTMLSLHSNNFNGRIPSLGGSDCLLNMIDLSNNQLQGPLPRSLSNCSKLNFLNAGNNRIRDGFPSWLGPLSDLRVLILRSNYFHGRIEGPKSGPVFPKLRIIDLSHNNFQGSLPSLYFQYWIYMREASPEENSYLTTHIYWEAEFVSDSPLYDFSMTIVNKGLKMEYEKVPGYFKVVDLSSNNFTEEIPDSIAGLDGLQLLNLSNNMLTGSVPSSLGTLIQLEALDLSRNELSGEIPRQLTKLTFLSFFDVSHNNLTGPIPEGKQFDSFQNNSYLGNKGLCGSPLSRKCGRTRPLRQPSPKSVENDEGSDVPFEIEWKAVAVGYAVTFVIAALLGHKFITERPDWFARTFGLRQLRAGNVTLWLSN